MKTLRVNNGIMANRFVFIMYQATPTTTKQILENAIVNNQNQVIIHIMGNDQTIIKDLERLELRLHQQSSSASNQELKISPIESLENKTKLSSAIQMERINSGNSQEYVIDLLPYIEKNKYDHYFLIEKVQAEVGDIQLYVRTDDTNCARINFLFKEIKSTKVKSKYYNQIVCDHQINTNISDGIASIHKPLVAFKGKKLSCQLSINYKPISEQLENQMQNFLPKYWSFNYQQYVGKIEDSDNYYYVNDKRQIIVFKKVDNTTYIEESGSGMILQTTTTGCIITDLNQTEYHFEYGYLTKITNGNTSIHIQYEIYNGKRRIAGIVDSSNRELYFTYEQGKITINSMFCNELSIIIENNKLVEIIEPDNTNVITNDIYYGYSNGLLRRIERRKEKAVFNYYQNGNIQKIISYRNNSKENTTEFTYKSTYTLVEYYKDEKVAEELIKEKYYFNEEKEYTRSVEVVGEKESEIETIKEDEIYHEIEQEKDYFISTLLYAQGTYSYPNNMYVDSGDIVLDCPYEIENVTKLHNLFLNIRVHTQKSFFIRKEAGYDYSLKYKIEVRNSKSEDYKVIAEGSLLKESYADFLKDPELPDDSSKKYMEQLDIPLTNDQKELLLNSGLIKLTFISNKIMSIENPILTLTCKTNRLPIYYTSVKIVNSFIGDKAYFLRGNYPYEDVFWLGYGMLEYPSVIKYNQNNGPEVTLSSNIEITYKDILMNKKNYYRNKNIFYYNNLKDAISNFNYDTLEIGNAGGTYKFTHLQFCQVMYQKQVDGSFSRIYIAYDYEERDDQIVMVQDQVQIFGEIEDNIDKKEEIKIYDLEGKLLEEISTYNYLHVLYNHISADTQMQHEGFTNTKKEYTYDAYGNLTQEKVGTIPVIAGIDDTKDDRYYLEIDEEGELYTVHYTYDKNNNNCIQKTVTKGEDIITDYTYTYDNLGNLLSITDETSPQQNKTEYSYSPYFKELVEVKQGNAKKVITYRNNKLMKVTDTYGMYYNYQYDQKEDLSQINYQTSMISYPLENYTEIKPLPNNTLNITKGQTGYIVEYNNTNRVGYAYDKYGNLIKQYEYRLSSDQMEVTSVAIYGEEKLNDGTSIYEINDLSDERIIKYGKSNLRILIDYFANTKTIFKYNYDNECTESITYDLTTNEIKNKVTKEINNNILSKFTIEDLQETSYTYNKNGRINQENIYTKKNKNINVNYTYDNYQRIKNINYTYYVNPSNVYNSEEYTYEENKIKTYKNSYSNTNYELTYDNQDRIVEVKENNKQPKTYTYNELGYLIKEKDENQETIYTYDNEANITTKKTYNLNNELINDIIYTYDEDDKNKLITVIQNNQTTNITYDDIFNVKSYSGMTFEYARGRLVSKVNKNNQSYTYIYNNNDQRIKKETPNSTTEYTYLNNKLIKEQVFVGEESSYEIDYIYTLNKLIGFEYSGNDYFYEYDILGNIIGIYNNNQLIARYTYDAYGNHKVYNSNNQIDNNENFIGNINKIRYKGYYYDVETKLYWVSSRYYNPQWGRFIQSDTLDYIEPSSINGINLYAYCRNNPISFTYNSSVGTVGTTIGSANSVANTGISNNQQGNLYSNSINIIGGLHAMFSIFAFVDQWSGFLSGGLDGGLGYWGPEGFGIQSLGRYSNMVSKFGKGMIIAGSILSWGSSVYNNFTNPNYTMGEAFGASAMDAGYYAVKGVGTYYAGIGVGKAAVGLGIAAGGAAITYLGVGFAGALAIGGGVAVVVGIAGAVAIYYLGELLDYGWSELKKALFE